MNYGGAGRSRRALFWRGQLRAEGPGAALVPRGFTCPGSQVAEGGSGQGCPHSEVQLCPDVGLLAFKQSRLVRA